MENENFSDHNSGEEFEDFTIKPNIKNKDITKYYLPVFVARVANPDIFVFSTPVNKPSIVPVKKKRKLSVSSSETSPLKKMKVNQANEETQYHTFDLKKSSYASKITPCSVSIPLTENPSSHCFILPLNAFLSPTVKRLLLNSYSSSKSSKVKTKDGQFTIKTVHSSKRIVSDDESDFEISPNQHLAPNKIDTLQENRKEVNIYSSSLYSDDSNSSSSQLSSPSLLSQQSSHENNQTLEKNVHLDSNNGILFEERKATENSKEDKSDFNKQQSDSDSSRSSSPSLLSQSNQINSLQILEKTLSPKSAVELNFIKILDKTLSPKSPLDTSPSKLKLETKVDDLIASDSNNSLHNVDQPSQGNSSVQNPECNNFNKELKKEIKKEIKSENNASTSSLESKLFSSLPVTSDNLNNLEEQNNVVTEKHSNVIKPVICEDIKIEEKKSSNIFHCTRQFIIIEPLATKPSSVTNDKQLQLNSPDFSYSQEDEIIYINSDDEDEKVGKTANIFVISSDEENDHDSEQSWEDTNVNFDLEKEKANLSDEYMLPSLPFELGSSDDEQDDANRELVIGSQPFSCSNESEDSLGNLEINHGFLQTDKSFLTADAVKLSVDDGISESCNKSDKDIIYKFKTLNKSRSAILLTELPIAKELGKKKKTVPVKSGHNISSETKVNTLREKNIEKKKKFKGDKGKEDIRTKCQKGLQSSCYPHMNSNNKSKCHIKTTKGQSSTAPKAITVNESSNLFLSLAKSSVCDKMSPDKNVLPLSNIQQISQIIKEKQLKPKNVESRFRSRQCSLTESIITANQKNTLPKDNVTSPVTSSVLPFVNKKDSSTDKISSDMQVISPALLGKCEELKSPNNSDSSIFNNLGRKSFDNEQSVKLNSSNKKVTFNDVVQSRFVDEIDTKLTTNKEQLKNLSIPSTSEISGVKTSVMGNIRASVSEGGDVIGSILNNNYSNVASANTKSIFSYDEIKDFIHHLLICTPLWLNQQKNHRQNNNDSLPPHLEEHYSYRSSVCYNSYSDYFNIYRSFLVLETWEKIYHDYQHCKSKMLEVKCILSEFDEKSNTINGKERVFRTVTFKGRSDSKNYFYKNDFVIVEQRFKGKEKIQSFGFIKNIARSHEGPYSIVLLTVIVKRLIESFVQVHAEATLKKVSNIIMSLRQFQALQVINRNLLIKDILNPSVDHFSPEIVTVGKTLLIQNKYNISQRNAILIAADMALLPYTIPKILLIQGPPGTGKSHTIVGIIQQIFAQAINSSDKSVDKPKILLCAPSNAAIDHLVEQLIAVVIKQDSNSLIDTLAASNKEKRDKMLLRLKSRSSEPLKYTLDYYVNEYYAKERSNSNVEESYEKSIFHHKEQISILQNELNVYEVTEEKEKIKNTRIKLKSLKTRLHNLEYANQKFSKFSANKMSEEQKRRIQMKVFSDADIVACTLHSSGNHILDYYCAQVEKNSRKFSCVIIDEAANCTELDSLIPLQYFSSKVILIGDTKQLPPTILSKRAIKLFFNISMMERFFQFFEANPQHLLLDTQYRMHPDICAFPSQQFYKGKLKNDHTLEIKSNNFPFKPYLLIDLVDSQESTSSGLSVQNNLEAKCIIELCKFIVQYIQTHRLGIITPYKEQRDLLRNQLNKSSLEKIIVNTVDAFQGQEKDMIILSCVRAKSASGKIGFLNEAARMNVALTRAKYSLIIIGHMKSLKVNGDWNALIDNARKRDLLFKVERIEYFDQICTKILKSNSI